MLKKVQDVESKLSSLTLTKLDLMSFLEDITIELKLLKHKLQLPYHGHKFSIMTPPSDSSDDEILDLVSLDESESPKDNDSVPVPFGTYLSPEAFNQELTEDKEAELSTNFNLQTFNIIPNVQISYIYPYILMLECSSLILE